MVAEGVHEQAVILPRKLCFGCDIRRLAASLALTSAVEGERLGRHRAELDRKASGFGRHPLTEVVDKLTGDLRLPPQWPGARMCSTAALTSAAHATRVAVSRTRSTGVLRWKDDGVHPGPHGSLRRAHRGDGVEVDEPCEVEILGSARHTFQEEVAVAVLLEVRHVRPLQALHGAARAARAARATRYEPKATRSGPDEPSVRMDVLAGQQHLVGVGRRGPRPPIGTGRHTRHESGGRRQSPCAAWASASSTQSRTCWSASE